MRKTRRDAWGESLPEETRRDIYAMTKPPREGEDRPWLRDWDRDVRPWLSLRGVPEPSRAAWYRFVARMREDEAADRVACVEASRRIARGIQKADVDPRLAADMMTALSVDAAARGDGEASRILADSAAKYHAAANAAERLRLESARQRTAEGQLRLAREKFEAAERRLQAVADAADAMRGGKVDPEKVADEIDRILGRRK